MGITKDEALQKTGDFLSSRLKGRLEIVEHLTDSFYDPGNIDFEKSWIVLIHPEETMLARGQQHIVIDKENGAVTEVIST